jgi:hypothetical protein
MKKTKPQPHEAIQFCHIAPTDFLEAVTPHNGAHLLLAHLVESDPEYADYYFRLRDGKYKIMDNSAFEMFKQGRPMYDASKLIEMARRCGADCIVLPDYPKENGKKTRDAAIQYGPAFRSAGFDTFFCPQSELGNIDELVYTFNWGLEQSYIDVVGVSILACPIALGVNEQKLEHGEERDAGYKLQRYLSRYRVLQILAERGVLDDRALKRFHCLGMTDGPNEIMLLKQFAPYIRSWDSSAAVWAGLNHMLFDQSPTGLRYGKFEKEVDFNLKKRDVDAQAVVDMFANINTINGMIAMTTSQNTNEW